MSDADFMKALDNEAYIILLEDKLEEKDKRIEELRDKVAELEDLLKDATRALGESE